MFRLLFKAYPQHPFLTFLSISIQVCIKSLILGKSSSGQFIAAGDDDGTLHILEVPKSLAKIARNEVLFLIVILENDCHQLF